MADKKLSERLCIFLLRKGFTIKSLIGCCFDVLARKGSRILLVKILLDANAVSEEHARQMHSISSYIRASPLVIAEKAGSVLGNNVVYSRLGIYTMNFATFANCMDEKLPFVASTNAGLIANIVGEKLRQKREQQGLSLAQISRKIGVSRRMISRYEKGDQQGIAQLTMAKAEKMYDVFGHEVFEKIDVFVNPQNYERFVAGRNMSILQTPITKKYSELGFESSEARKVPFDIIARKDDELILTEVGDRVNPDATLLSRLIDADNLVIFDKKRPIEEGIPAITKEEFMEFEEANELIKFLREF